MGKQRCGSSRRDCNGELNGLNVYNFPDGKQQTFTPDGTPLTDADYLFNRQQTNNSGYPNGQRQDETHFDESGKQTAPDPNGCVIPKWQFES